MSDTAEKKRRQMRRRRPLRRTIAAVGGYFWLPCPVCGEGFGGHEVVGAVTVPGKELDGNRRVICPACELSQPGPVRQGSE